MTRPTPDYILLAQTLRYEGSDPAWNLLAGFSYALANDQPVTNEVVADTFCFMSGTTCELELAVERGCSEDLTVGVNLGWIDSVEVTPLGPTATSDIVVPGGITVKHMSKTGEGYERFASGANYLARNVAGKPVYTLTQREAMANDHNTTSEQILHRVNDADSGDAIISMTSSYNPSTREFWRVNSSGLLELTSDLQAASRFGIGTNAMGTMTIAHDQTHLNAQTNATQLCFGADPSLAITRVVVSEFPRPTPQ